MIEERKKIKIERRGRNEKVVIEELNKIKRKDGLKIEEESKGMDNESWIKIEMDGRREKGKKVEMKIRRNIEWKSIKKIINEIINIIRGDKIRRKEIGRIERGSNKERKRWMVIIENGDWRIVKSLRNGFRRSINGKSERIENKDKKNRIENEEEKLIDEEKEYIGNNNIR